MERLYREMTIEDYADSYSLWLQTEGMALSEADSEEAIAGYLKRNPGFSFVCELDGRIVGTILCGHDGRRGYVYHAAVHPELRGRGVGKELVSRSLARLGEAGITKCHLFVLENNEIGLRFWQRAGWQKRSGFYVCSADIGEAR
jgi:ribosomal protein S18 acetylase RimI-like enzyme